MLEPPAYFEIPMDFDDYEEEKEMPIEDNQLLIAEEKIAQQSQVVKVEGLID